MKNYTIEQKINEYFVFQLKIAVDKEDWEGVEYYAHQLKCNKKMRKFIEELEENGTAKLRF